ncbi:MAG: hypothetical protein AB1650_02265 [Candidatus Omnitrophota bacterium]
MRDKIFISLIVVQLSVCGIVFSGQFPESRQHLVKTTLPDIYLVASRHERRKENSMGPSGMGAELVNWIKSNISRDTGMPLSFEVAEDKKHSVYSGIGGNETVEGVIERTIVEEGLVIYDGAVAQIVLTMFGAESDMKQVQDMFDVYWEGKLGKLPSIRAGDNFIYDPDDPRLVSGDPDEKGRRGFIYRIINANGRYNMEDPLDGKTSLEGFPNWPAIHWEDWKPVAGENAWVTMAAMHFYHKKYYDRREGKCRFVPYAAEYELAEELARAAMMLGAENGGIRMAPIGTYREAEDFSGPGSPGQGTWWYRQISTENNVSWYAAFRMLYQVTGDSVYLEAMEGIENYFRQAFNHEGGFFYQGMNFYENEWRPNNEHFALDVQTWAISALGPKKIDGWFGHGAAFKMWETAKYYSGYFEDGKIMGVGYTHEHDQISVEWTAGAILALQLLSDYYGGFDPEIARGIRADMKTMRDGIERLRKDLSRGRAAYAYSLKRKYIPFGWYSHSPDVLSLASTGWVVMIDNQFNPFELSM